MDINGDSKVNYIEFVAATMEQKQWATVEHLHYAFDKLDSTHSGNLTREELFSLLGVRALVSARPPFLLLSGIKSSFSLKQQPTTLSFYYRRAKMFI